MRELQRQPFPGCLGWGQKKVRESLLLRQHPHLRISSIQKHRACQSTALLECSFLNPNSASLGICVFRLLAHFCSPVWEAITKKCCHKYLRMQVISPLGRNMGVSLLSHVMLMCIRLGEKFHNAFPNWQYWLDFSPTMFESGPGPHPCPGNCQNS